MVWAREITDRARRGGGPPISKKTLHTAERIRRLGFSVVTDLEAQKAPHHVFRWVAWARKGGPAEQRLRADLVLHLRRTFERAEDGWFVEREHQAAYRVWMDARAEVAKRGLIMPRADEVSAERYAEAITATAQVASRRRDPLLNALGDEATLRALARKIAAQGGHTST
jgi:signal transduction histidine kinase